jgi:ABC-type branched-subunit amino acid transport system substrate-binding protein
MGRRRHVMRKALSAGAAIALVAACTNSDPVSDTASSGSTDGGTNSISDGVDPSTPSSGAVVGDSTGVSDDTIKIGWPTIDQAVLVDAGLATDTGDITTIAQSMVDAWNADGGINGRQVELVTRTFGSDIANFLPDMQRVCLELTEDEQVFATVAFSWFGDAVTCVAGDHDMPLLTATSLPGTVLASGNDNIFLANFTWEEALASAVRVVDDAGALDNLETLGVFGPLEPGARAAVDNGLKPALADVGRTIDEDGMIPPTAPVDNAAIAAVVSRFKAEGVDGVFAIGNFYVNGAFMTEAERQDYRPTYVMSDMSEGTDDLVLSFAPAAQLASAIGASWKGKPPTPTTTAADQECLDTYAPDANASVTQAIGAAQTCELLRLLRRGLEGAGVTPTRESFVAAMEGIGAFTMSGGGGGSYGSGNYTMPDQVRLVRFDLDGCQCWTAEGDWIDVDG